MERQRDLVEALNACTPDALRELRKRLDRPALDLRVPIYSGALARREDLILRTEKFWKEFTKALATAKTLRTSYQSAATRANYVAYRRQTRYVNRVWRQFQSARIVASQC